MKPEIASHVQVYSVPKPTNHFLKPRTAPQLFRAERRLGFEEPEEVFCDWVDRDVASCLVHTGILSMQEN